MDYMSDIALWKSETDCPDMGRTSIQVSEELADELYSRKDRGESYEDIIWQLIDQADAEPPPGDQADESDSERN